MNFLDALAKVFRPQQQQAANINPSIGQPMGDTPQPAYQIKDDESYQSQPMIQNPSSGIQSDVTQNQPYVRDMGMNSGGIMSPQDTPQIRMNKTLDERDSIATQPIINADKGVKGWLKEFAQNALHSAGGAARNGGDLTQILGAAIGGGGYGAIDRKTNERRNQQQELAKIDTQIQGQQKNMDWQTGQDYKQAQIGIANQKPIIEQQKVGISQQRADADELYKKERIALGVAVAEKNAKYRDALIRIGDEKLDQGDARIAILKEGLIDKDLDREIKLKIADMMVKNHIDTTTIRANTARDIASMNQSGASSRQKIEISARKELEAYKAAQATGNVAEIEASKKRLMDYEQQLLKP
jgi:hypothetical protein